MYCDHRSPRGRRHNRRHQRDKTSDPTGAPPTLVASPSTQTIGRAGWAGVRLGRAAADGRASFVFSPQACKWLDFVRPAPARCMQPQSEGIRTIWPTTGHETGPRFGGHFAAAKSDFPRRDDAPAWRSARKPCAPSNARKLRLHECSIPIRADPCAPGQPCAPSPRSSQGEMSPGRSRKRIASNVEAPRRFGHRAHR